MGKEPDFVDDKTHEAALAFLEREGLTRPSAAATGVRTGDVIVGVCECNWGLTIRVSRDVAPCHNPRFFCRHCLEDAFNLHNFVVFRPPERRDRAHT